MPEELCTEIYEHIQRDFVQIKEFLNWHATCHRYWDEYLVLSETETMALCARKKEENRRRLLTTLRVEYKNNMIEYTMFIHILRNCQRVTERIVSIAGADLFDTDLPCSKRTGFCVCRCGLFHGVSFVSRFDEETSDTQDVITDESMVVLCAVANRIYVRYGWRMSLVFRRSNQSPLNVDLPCPSPWNVPVECDIYIR